MFSWVAFGFCESLSEVDYDLCNVHVYELWILIFEWGKPLWFYIKWDDFKWTLVFLLLYLATKPTWTSPIAMDMLDACWALYAHPVAI